MSIVFRHIIAALAREGIWFLYQINAYAAIITENTKGTVLTGYTLTSKQAHHEKIIQKNHIISQSCRYGHMAFAAGFSEFSGYFSGVIVGDERGIDQFAPSPRRNLAPDSG